MHVCKGTTKNNKKITSQTQSIMGRGRKRNIQNIKLQEFNKEIHLRKYQMAEVVEERQKNLESTEKLIQLLKTHKSVDNISLFKHLGSVLHKLLNDPSKQL